MFVLLYFGCGKEAVGFPVCFKTATRLGPFPRFRFQSEQLPEAGSNGPRTTGTDIMTIAFVYIGCDVSKRFLDIYDPSDGAARRIANARAAIDAWLEGLAEKQAFVVFEATGAYDQALRHGLARAGVAGARVNPMMARRFAEAGVSTVEAGDLPSCDCECGCAAAGARARAMAWRRARGI